MVWVEDLHAFSTHSPWCLSEKKIHDGHRTGTSHITEVCVHQQRGPAGPSANIGGQSVDHLEAQASEVSCVQVSHSDTSLGSHTVFSLPLHL